MKLNYSLKNYNTFGLDVKAKKILEIFSEEDLTAYLKSSGMEDRPILVLGGGSNILFSDDFNGTVLKISIPGISIEREDEKGVLLKAGAGILWDDLVEYAVANNLAGIENLSLIPGCAGAAPIQNIGAYGQELSNVFHSLEGFLISACEKIIFNKADCEFGYRNSIFKNEQKNRFIITYITLYLHKKFVPEYSYTQVSDELKNRGLQNPSLRDMRNTISDIRKSKLPDPALIGNAGSFFKNPEISSIQFEELKNKYPELRGFKTTNDNYKLYAGWLIEKCGWRGNREGEVGTYPQQALVVVNYGGATGKDIILYKDKIKTSVYNTFGIQLEEEVNII